MSEYLGFAIDIGAYFLFTHLETRLKENLDAIGSIPTFKCFKSLKETLLQDPQSCDPHRDLSPSRLSSIPYAIVLGQAEPTEQPINSDHVSQKGIIKVTEKFQASLNRDIKNKEWSEEVDRKISSQVKSVPFCIALAADALYAKPAKLTSMKQLGRVVRFVDVNRVGNSLKQEMELVCRKFIPSEECFTSHELAKMTKRAGQALTEHLMPCGTQVTAVGKLVLDKSRNEVRLVCPSSQYRYILTTNLESVLDGMEDEAHYYNMCRRVAVVAGLFFFFLASDRLYKDFKEWRNKTS